MKQLFLHDGYIPGIAQQNLFHDGILSARYSNREGILAVSCSMIYSKKSNE